MGLLVTTQEVRSRVSLQDDPGINAAIESARSGALMRVSSLLPQRSFERKSWRDVFCATPVDIDPTEGVFALRLSNGFVFDGSVTVKQGYSFMEITEDVTGFVVDYEKGIVRIGAEAESTLYFAVEYVAGFDPLPVEGDDPIENPTADPPDWLKEVILTLTILIMTSQQIMDDKAKLSGVVPVLEGQWKSILDSHLRFNTFYIYPVA